MRFEIPVKILEAHLELEKQRCGDNYIALVLSEAIKILEREDK